MNWPRALAPFGVALTLVGILAAAGRWAPVMGPALVQVTGLTPTDVEPGDRIAIAGDGFPAGKEARVTFRGTLHRPGEAPAGDAEIAAVGVVTGPDEVQVDFRETTQALFCGAGDRATHTTFEGDVEVAFAAAAPGAAPIAGFLRHAVLDVRPSASAADRARESEGQRVLAFVGLHLASPTRRGLGLAVESVDPGSRAELAGLAVGDVLSSFDGVRVVSVGDVVAPPGEQEAILGVRTAGATVDTLRPLSVDGLGAGPPLQFFAGAMFIMAALSIVILSRSPLPAFLGGSLQRAAGLLRTRDAAANGARGTRGANAPTVRPPNRSPWARLARSTVTAALRETLPPASVWVVVDALGAGLLAVLPFGQYLIAARLDVGLLFLCAVTSLTVAAVLGAPSSWGGLLRAAHVAWQHVPAAIATASVVFATGSLRIQEIDRAQGGWPWDWLAFRSPAALLAFSLLVGCALIEPDVEGPSASGVEALIESEASGTRPSRGAGVEVTCRAHRFIIAGLASALFLGGWSLPGLLPAQQDGRLLLELGGVVCFLAKTWALVIALSAVRWSRPMQRLAVRTRVTTVFGLPLALGALAVTVAWTWWSPERAAQLFISGSLVATTVLAVVAVIQRVRHGVLASSADGHLSPFL